MKMTELNPRERPREKLMDSGPESLSVPELLAILLRTGTTEENAVQLGARIFDEAGCSLSELFSFSPDALSRIRGVGKCKAAEIQAAFELGRRFFDENGSGGKRPITSSRQAFEQLWPKMKGLRKEECWALFLNTAGRLICRKRITTGASGTTLIDNSEILKTALEKSASGVIVAHNHPSGNPRPSEADIRSTENLREACRVVDICLMDHIIISDGSYFSFSDGKEEVAQSRAD